MRDDPSFCRFALYCIRYEPAQRLSTLSALR